MGAAVGLTVLGASVGMAWGDGQAVLGDPVGVTVGAALLGDPVGGAMGDTLVGRAWVGDAVGVLERLSVSPWRVGARVLGAALGASVGTSAGPGCCTPLEVHQ